MALPGVSEVPRVLAIDDERRMREYVRRKFEGGASNKILHTVRGVGYVLRSGGP